MTAVEREQPLHDAGPQPGGGHGPPWRSMPSWFFSVQMIASTRLPEPVRKVPGTFVFAGRADQVQAEAGAGRRTPRYPRPARPLVGHDGGTGRRAVGGPVVEHLPGLVTLAIQLRVGPGQTRSPSPRRCTSASAWPPQYQARMRRAVNRTRPTPNRPDRRAVTADWPHGTGVASSSRTSSAPRPAWQAASHRSAASSSGPAFLHPLVVFALRQQPREQVPHP